MSTALGRDAEARVAEYLRGIGYVIRDQNWRTRYCEIDIVAQCRNVVWFVEVKYRRTAAQGEGYEYITPKKLSQMKFAAEMWVAHARWSGEYRLAVMSVSDHAIELIEDIV